ncbi:MAG: choice-of-anchor D domain-containing protein [Polyangiaceae bacterium]|jgi:MYXO-CTERM domain-containing protein|nr:choice-of-anchor D domain-containing protein [Polyangiaceae bacterium]
MIRPSRRPSFPVAPLALALLVCPSLAAAEDPLPCDYPEDPSFRCFRSEEVLLSKNSSSLPIKNGLSTGWLNCKPENKGLPCNQQPTSCSTLGACLELGLDDSKLNLAMKHQWDVYWPQAGKLQLIPRQPPKEGGTFTFAYTLKPTFSIFMDALGQQIFFTIDPTQILDVLDKSGTVKEFKSSASGDCRFAPFAFDPPVICKAKAIPGTVFSFGLSDIGIDIDKFAKISLGMDVTTSDVQFTWQTTEILVTDPAASADDQPPPITKDNPSTSISYTGGGKLGPTAQAKGKLTYKGMTALYPTIATEEIAGFAIKFKWPIDVGAELPFEGEIPYALNPTTVDILLPDLSVSTKVNSDGDVDFGTVEVGQQKAQNVTLENSGLMEVVGDVVSSLGSEFKVSKTNFNLKPDGEELNKDTFSITFIPKKSGEVKATVFVKSNDPDEPERIIKVKGFGKMPSEPEPEPEPEPEAGSGGTGGKKTNTGNSVTEETSASDGGCGCRAAGTPPARSAGSLALLALAALGLRRRRS